METGQTGGEHAVVRHGRLGEQDAAGFANPGRGGRVRDGRFERGGRGAERDRSAAGRDVFLERQGNAVDRAKWLADVPAGFGRLRVFARTRRVIRVKRVQLGLARLDALDDGFGHLHRRKRSRAVLRDQFDSGQVR